MLESGLYLAYVTPDGSWSIDTMAGLASTPLAITSSTIADQDIKTCINNAAEKYTSHIMGQKAGSQPDNGWGLDKTFHPGAAHSRHDFNNDKKYFFDVMLSEVNDVLTLSYYFFDNSPHKTMLCPLKATTHQITNDNSIYSTATSKDKTVCQIHDRTDMSVVDSIICNGSDILYNVTIDSKKLISYGATIDYSINYNSNQIIASVSGCSNLSNYPDINLPSSSFEFISAINNQNIFDGMSKVISISSNGVTDTLSATINFNESTLESNGISYSDLAGSLAGSGIFKLASSDSGKNISVSPRYDSSISFYTPTTTPSFSPNITGIYGSKTIQAIIPEPDSVKFAYFHTSVNQDLIDPALYSNGSFTIDFDGIHKKYIGKALKLRVMYDGLGSNSYTDSQQIYPFYNNYYNLVDLEIKLSGVVYAGDPPVSSGYEAVWFSSIDEVVQINNLSETFYSSADPIVYLSFALAPNLTHINGEQVEASLMPRPATAYLIAVPYDPSSPLHSQRSNIYFAAPWQLGTGVTSADERKKFPSVSSLHAINMLNSADALGAVTTHKTLAVASQPFSKTTYTTNSYVTLPTGKYGLFLVVLSEPDDDPDIVTTSELATAYCISNPGSDVTFEVPVRVK